jgi:hypothetical protein
MPDLTFAINSWREQLQNRSLGSVERSSRLAKNFFFLLPKSRAGNDVEPNVASHIRRKILI